MLPSPADLPRHYDVRELRVAPNVVLAPMEGVTDLTFRRLIRQIGGVGLTVTEFVASSGLKEGSDRMMETCAFDPDERPVAVQLYGKDPRTMGEAARIVEAMGVDIIDINMGCPSKKVCAHSGGSALMKEPELARDIVREVVAAVQVPVTVKMRSGFDAERRNAPEIAWICQEEGASALAIHWRTREDKYGGERQVDKIAEAVQRVSLPVLANGDIIDIPSAHRMLRETGCAGLMVGRGAIRNPWVLRQISQWLAGEEPVRVDAAEKRRAIPPLEDRFNVKRIGLVEKEYHFRDQAGRVAFTDKFMSVSTGSESPAAIKAMVDRAAERGWKAVRLNGSPEFLRQGWIAATAQGLKPVGHTPTTGDREAAAKERLRLQVNQNAPTSQRPGEAIVRVQSTHIEQVTGGRSAATLGGQQQLAAAIEKALADAKVSPELRGQVRVMMIAEGAMRVARGDRFKVPVYDSRAPRVRSKSAQSVVHRPGGWERSR